MIKKWVTRLLLVLVGIGVFRGVVLYNQTDHGSKATRAANAIINASEEVTYKWFGKAMDEITGGANKAPGVINNTVSTITNPSALPSASASKHK